MLSPKSRSARSKQSPLIVVINASACDTYTIRSASQQSVYSPEPDVSVRVMPQTQAVLSQVLPMPSEDASLVTWLSVQNKEDKSALFAVIYCGAELLLIPCAADPVCLLVPKEESRVTGIQDYHKAQSFLLIPQRTPAAPALPLLGRRICEWTKRHSNWEPVSPTASSGNGSEESSSGNDAPRQL